MADPPGGIWSFGIRLNGSFARPKNSQCMLTKRSECRPAVSEHPLSKHPINLHKKIPAGFTGRDDAEKMTDGKVALGGPSRVCVMRLVFGANLHGLHAGFSLGLAFEGAVVNDRRGGGSRLR